MPFMDWSGQVRVRDAAREDAVAFEEETRIPVRFLNRANAPQRHDTHTHWRGNSRELRHYVDGVSEDDFAARGITIFVQAYPETVDHRVDFHYHEVPTDELTKGGWGEYEPEGPRELPEMSGLEICGFTRDQVESMGGEPIMVGEACLGASFDEGRCVFLFQGAFGYSNYAHFNFPKLVFEKAMLLADPERMAELIERQKAEARDAFIQMMQDRGEAAITEARTNADKFAIEYARAQEASVIAKGNLDSYSKQLEHLLDRGDAVTDDMVDREWQAITNNVNVERFTAGTNKVCPTNRYGEDILDREMIDNTYLKVFTKHLWITNSETGRKLPLGKFEVDMNFGTNRLKIKNLTMQQSYGETSIDHPHVRGGYLCAAEYATAITTLLRDRKLASMTNMLFSILGTCTMEDTWGRSGIRLWEAADNELRRQHGWPEWTADEDEHPLAVEMAEAEALVADVPDDNETTEEVAA